MSSFQSMFRLESVVCTVQVTLHTMAPRPANRFGARPKLLEDVPPAVRARMWYMHDGAPAHFSCAVRDIFNHTDHDQWIGTGGPTAWPPLSPDFNPLDFYPWRHLTTLAYAAPVDNGEALHYRIVDALSDYRQLLQHL
jgi:hypothetical protein